MKPPLDTALFFVSILIKLIKESPGLPQVFIQNAAPYCVFITSQLTLAASHLDDLHDLK